MGEVSLCDFLPCLVEASHNHCLSLAEVGRAQVLTRWRNLEIRWLWSRLPRKSNLGAEFRYPESEQCPAHQTELLASPVPSPGQAVGLTPNSSAGALVLGDNCGGLEQSCLQPCPYHRVAEQHLDIRTTAGCLCGGSEYIVTPPSSSS